ncbi:MAG: hypothetical protein IJ489_03580 [Clostridia bacterium]|nr:hypothetical protein [Clostridia bacterium]
METVAENAFHIVGKNLKRTTYALSRSIEKSFAHLCEQAHMIAHTLINETGQTDVLGAVLTSDEAARIYRESFSSEQEEALFAEINRAQEPYCRRTLSRLFRLYLCDAIAKQSDDVTLTRIAPLVCGEGVPLPQKKEKTVAFLRNVQASRAFEYFARSLGGVSAVYESNFLNACESVYTEQATYAIIPIYSTADGRLGSFYRQIEKYELSIVLTCDIDSDDGENTTTFALVYKDRLYIETDGEPIYECKITFDTLDQIADIMDAASYFGVTIHALDALPVVFSGRTNAFAIIFGLQNANIGGFFSYLALEYPQTAVIGIYRKLSYS